MKTSNLYNKGGSVNVKRWNRSRQRSFLYTEPTLWCYADDYLDYFSGAVRPVPEGWTTYGVTFQTLGGPNTTATALVACPGKVEIVTLLHHWNSNKTPGHPYTATLYKPQEPT